ncbi:MAG: sensor histidine kinase [Candidatus Obscuribacterales bacterium]|nr:sensor histidine kinase [Steroidobacteraceae bacterium]
MNVATIADPELQPADLLTTTALLHRPQRTPNLYAEVAAFCELSQILANDPRSALRRFLEIALRLCNAGTAGLSLLRPNVVGQAMLHWAAISGELTANEGIDTPRDFSSCGLCLDVGTTILVSQPERAFAYLRGIRPAIVEGLIVPLYDNAKRPLGTIWIAHHDSAAFFCANDARIVEQLAIQLVLALKLLEEAAEHRYALALIESHKVARRTVTHDLAEERSRRERAEMSETGIRQALLFKDAVIQDVDHRAKNTIQIAANLLAVQARTTSSAEVRGALQEANRRLLLLAKVHELLMSNHSAREILMPTLLQAIGDALRQSFAETASYIRLRVTSEPIMLSEDDAIPIALFTNEVVTNAYKHAFPSGSAGEITVDLSLAAKDTVILQITDNGIGMHAMSAHGMGQKLIRSFAAHLKGVLVYATSTNAAGLAVTLTIHRATQVRDASASVESNVAAMDKVARSSMHEDYASNIPAENTASAP